MIQRPKGTADILPGQIELWQFVEKTVYKVMNQYRFIEMRTPMFESYDLFSRGVGTTTDVVSKEMYDFNDKGNRHMALKPEGTASIVRSFIENKLYGPEYVKPYKVYYIAPMFRYERPQGGRQRQFHQIGVEVFDGVEGVTDVETIALAHDLFRQLGLKNIKLVINSLGDTEARSTYRQALIDYLLPFEDELSEDSKIRLHKNPLRVLDSKDKRDKEIVKGAPSILDFLSPHSQERFEHVQKLLNELGIAFEIEANMVRGLDYYQDTIFEFMVNDPVFGAETTICGGGNYTGLTHELSDGKIDVPGFGFGIGFERLVLLMEAQGLHPETIHPLDVYIVNIGEGVRDATFNLAQALRHQNFTCDFDVKQRKAKRQYRDADRFKAKFIVTLGEEEMEQRELKVRHCESKEEHRVAIDLIMRDFSQVQALFNKK